jgi:hypothetical protein
VGIVGTVNHSALAVAQEFAAKQKKKERKAAPLPYFVAKNARHRTCQDLFP